MHIFTLVLLPKDVSDIETGVSKKLEPFNECTNENGFYDRYQIGGRWTGTLSKEYDPTKDPRNIETCNLCGGTGKRKDSDYEWHGGCNGCNGTGKSLKWPTEWVKSPTDVVTVRELLALDIKTGTPYAIVFDDTFKMCGTWNPETKEVDETMDWKNVVEQILKEHEEELAVVVDCHT